MWNYYAGVARPQTADKVVRDIEEACRVLDDHPLAGRARDELRPGLRSVAARPYVVFYRLSGETTEVVRVVHGRRDLDAIFSDDGGAPDR